MLRKGTHFTLFRVLPKNSPSKLAHQARTQCLRKHFSHLVLPGYLFQIHLPLPKEFICEMKFPVDVLCLDNACLVGRSLDCRPVIALHHRLDCPKHPSKPPSNSDSHIASTDAVRTPFGMGWQSCEGEITAIIFQLYMNYYDCYGWFERPAPLIYYVRANTTTYLFAVAN
jgi:hypothetical protein